MSEKTLAGVIDITEGPPMKRGVMCEVANGVNIPNLGERKFLGCTAEGGQRGMTAQICAANKTLMSVGQVTAQGNRVVFDNEGSYIDARHPEKNSGWKKWVACTCSKCGVSRKTTKEAGF